MPRGEGRLHVDVVDPVSEIRDQLQVGPGLGEHGSIDLVRDGGDENVHGPHGIHDLCLGHRLVVDVEPGVEKLAHPRLHDVG
jgi:hypothetical protein